MCILSDSERSKLQGFKTLLDDMSPMSFLQTERLTIKFGDILEPDEPQGKINVNDEAISAVMPLFRQLYDNKEQYSIPKIVAFLSQLDCTEMTVEWSKALKSVGLHFKQMRVNGDLEFMIDGVKYRPIELIDIYFYGASIHRNKKDAQEKFAKVFRAEPEGSIARMNMLTAVKDIYNLAQQLRKVVDRALNCPS